jgi:hypothetical protein
MHKLLLSKEINSTPATTPKVPGTVDWSQRKVVFDYTQGIEAQTWTVYHNLGSIPTTQVFINVDTSEGEISTETTAYTTTVVDSNTITIAFAAPQSGIVQCIAHASQNTTNPAIAEVAPPTTDVQISNSGIITIATIENNPTVDIQSLFTDPITGIVNNCDYIDVDNIPDAESPWAGAYQARIAGRVYHIRTFIVTAPTAQDADIVNGSQMVLHIDGSPITTYRDVLVLLGTPPYSVPDRITSSYIDLATINATLPEMYYTGGEVKCSSALLKSTYPPILVVE